MAENSETILKALLGDKAEQLTDKMDVVNDILNSEQAQALKNKLDSTAIQKAFEAGDSSQLQGFIKAVITTKEGQELAKQFGAILR